MKKNSMSNENIEMKSLVLLFAVVVIGVIIGIVVSVISLGILHERVSQIQEVQTIWSSFSTNFTVETILVCVNLSLLIGLLWLYGRDFSKTKSPFLLGLILFFLVLVIQSLLSLPIMNLLITVITIEKGFFCVFKTYLSAIFNIIAHFFETIALTILFYLSMK